MSRSSSVPITQKDLSSFLRKSMGYPGKMHHRIAILEKGLPVEWLRQIWQMCKDYIRVKKSVTDLDAAITL
jgi:hypothetical protein